MHRCAAGALTVLAGAALAAAPAAAAAPPRHVAIVVGHGTACVRWRSGITGLDVLSAVARVSFGTGPYTGFVVKINGVGQNPPDDTHYWSYWHNTGAGWTYSGAGSGSYRPAAGTVEGWSYDNGAAKASPPPRTDYAAICGRQDRAPAPTRTTTPPPAPSTTAMPTRPSTRAPTPTRRPLVAHRTTASADVPPSPEKSATREVRAHTGGTTARPAQSHITRTRRPPAADASRIRPTPSLTPLSHHHAAGPDTESPLPLVGGLAVVMLLAAGAGWAAWRRRSG